MRALRLLPALLLLAGCAGGEAPSGTEAAETEPAAAESSSASSAESPPAESAASEAPSAESTAETPSSESAPSSNVLAGDAVRIEGARAVQTPGGDTGAVYFRIVNPTDEDDLLQSVSTPVAKIAEVHETVQQGGITRMEAFPEGLPVPAGRVVVLQPGGKHVMLMALEAELEPGEEVELELTFNKAGTLRVTAPVVDLGG